MKVLLFEVHPTRSSGWSTLQARWREIVCIFAGNCVYFRGIVYNLQCLLQPVVSLSDTHVLVSQTHPAL